MKILAIISFIFFISCATSKNYTWENKVVSEKKYNKELKKYTKEFVKNSSVSDVVLMSELEVTYDTTKK